MTKKSQTVSALIIAAVIIAAILLPGYTKLQDLAAENKRLERRITQLKKSIEQLKTEKEKLESDILYIEKVAREKLGVVRKNEVVIEEKP